MATSRVTPDRRTPTSETTPASTSPRQASAVRSARGTQRRPGTTSSGRFVPAPATAGRGRLVVGGFFLMMAGVHLGIVAADAETYRDFAQGGLFAFVRDGWTHIVMARPQVYGLLLMAGEAVLGAALLTGGRAARTAWVG